MGNGWWRLLICVQGVHSAIRASFKTKCSCSVKTMQLSWLSCMCKIQQQCGSEGSRLLKASDVKPLSRFSIYKICL